MLSAMIPIYEKDYLIGAHSSDWHFGVFNPKLQYDILREQFIEPLIEAPLDYVTIDGDIFDHKFMSNSDAIMYALSTVDELIERVIKPKNATLIILGGTWSHDAGQLKLFYHYMKSFEVDVRVVETIKFEYVKGSRILCIPELSNVPEEVYQEYLFESGIYDSAIMHGTIKGSVNTDNPGSNTRLFTIEDFELCRGPIISGHIHGGGCFNKYFHYCGSPYTWQFGERNDKGYLISVQNLVTGDFYIHKELIQSFRYETIDADCILHYDPKDIIDYINRVKHEQGIDFIRLRFTQELDIEKRNIIENYYRNNKNVKFKYDYTSHTQKSIQNNIKQNELYESNSYLFDDSMNYNQKFVQFVNNEEGYEFITVERFKQILEDGL